MILGIYTKNRKKDKLWSFFTTAKTVELASKTREQLVKELREIGYDEAEAVVQKFDSVYDVPQTIGIVKPTKELYS